jgi:hypothetical protein
MLPIAIHAMKQGSINIGRMGRIPGVHGNKMKNANTVDKWLSLSEHSFLVGGRI